ncbi:hypothetical protein [Thermococcus prieurii]
MKWKALLALLLGLLVVGVTAGSAEATVGTPVGTSSPSDPWEAWAKQHTVRVLVVERIQYLNGKLIKQVEYTGDELQAKFGVDRISKVKVARMSLSELLKLYPLEAKTLALGMPVVRTYYKTTVLTTSDDPYPWWEHPPYLPRWTWDKLNTVDICSATLTMKKQTPSTSSGRVVPRTMSKKYSRMPAGTTGL